MLDRLTSFETTRLEDMGRGTQNPAKVGVLLVGDCLMLGASPAQALSSLRCEWWYAASCEKALAAMEERTFRVVLSKFKLADGSGRRLIPAVQMASAWLFLSFPVEEGCWWIPVIEAGQLPVKVSAVHSRQFRRVLVKILNALEAGKPQESTAEAADDLENLGL
jgi:hypothetical protein